MKDKPPIEQELLRPKTAAAYLGISLRGLNNLAERDPDFPRKVVLTKRAVGWRKKSLDQYLADKESAA